MVKNGTRLQSQVDDTQVIVVKSADSLDDLRCGGTAMIALDAEKSPADIDPKFSDGTVMGKRYVDADGNYELLCVKPGKGSLSVDGVALVTKDAKPLPASD